MSRARGGYSRGLDRGFGATLNAEVTTMWNVLDHDTRSAKQPERPHTVPSDRPQFSLAALLKLMTAVCVLFALVFQIQIVTHPLVVPLGVVVFPLATFIFLRLVDALA
jgi:hypothetical protein